MSPATSWDLGSVLRGEGMRCLRPPDRTGIPRGRDIGSLGMGAKLKQASGRRWARVGPALPS